MKKRPYNWSGCFKVRCEVYDYCCALRDGHKGWHKVFAHGMITEWDDTGAIMTRGWTPAFKKKERVVHEETNGASYPRRFTPSLVRDGVVTFPEPPLEWGKVTTVVLGGNFYRLDE